LQRSPIQNSLEIAFNGAPAESGGAFARDHEDILAGPQHSAAAPKKLADLPLDPIARH
jgi:hypothetical protein